MATVYPLSNICQLQFCSILCCDVIIDFHIIPSGLVEIDNDYTIEQTLVSIQINSKPKRYVLKWLDSKML